MKLAFIPDVHVKPNQDFSFLKSIGNLLAKKMPDVIVQGGDFADLPSLSSYDVGKKAFEGRRYSDDVDAAKLAMNILLKPIRDKQKMLREAHRPRWKPKLFMTLGNHCLSEDTEIYVVEKGWCFYSDITLADKVITMDANGYYEEQQIKDIISWDADEELYTTDTCTASMLVTGGHRVYYKTSGGATAVKLAKEFTGEFDLISSTNSPDEFSYSKEELQLAAWLCTDSHFGKYGTITLYQREDNADKIEQLLVALDVPFRKATRQRHITQIAGKELLKPCKASVEFYIGAANSQELSQRLQVFSNKRLPVWCKYLSNTQWDVFLTTLVDADGSVHKSGGSLMFYGKRDICEDVQLQCHLHGWRASITEYSPNQFRVNLVHTSKVRVKLEKQQYTGKVWCISVNNKNFLVRRNNKVSITGNCQRINRAVDTDRKLEGLIDISNLCYKEAGWEVIPFLEVLEVNGVAFSHYFCSGVMGRPVSSATLMLQKTYQSCVAGHKQGRDVAYSNKPNGDNITAIISGSCYPTNESYLNWQTNNHWRGMWMLHNVDNGSFDEQAISLDYITSKY